MAVGKPEVVRYLEVGFQAVGFRGGDRFQGVSLYQADVIRAGEFRHPVDFHLRVRAAKAVAKDVLLPDDYPPPDGLAEYQCPAGKYLGELKDVVPGSSQDGFLWKAEIQWKAAFLWKDGFLSKAAFQWMDGFQ